MEAMLPLRFLPFVLVVFMPLLRHAMHPVKATPPTNKNARPGRTWPARAPDLSETPVIVPEVGYELGLPRFHFFLLQRGLKYRLPQNRCQGLQPSVNGTALRPAIPRT
jgi:hypothetical protein